MLGTISWARQTVTRHAAFRAYWGNGELRPKEQNGVMEVSRKKELKEQRRATWWKYDYRSTMGELKCGEARTKTTR